MKKIEDLVEEIVFKDNRIVSSPEEFECVGQGRSAAVFKIKDINQVVKVFYPAHKHLAAREAEVYNRLSNRVFFPHLIEAGDGFLIMEYVEGITFYECLTTGKRITPEMVQKVDEVLTFVRSRGLTPSDIHLRNIMLTQNNEVILIDVVRFTQLHECEYWPDLKKAYDKFYKKKFFPKRFPKLLIEFIILLYHKRLLSI
ncbi:RIO1 family regulatory kinase/ATPase domain-containing protein [Halobacillus sp. K22]|uniref:RIO1 family regulatory kinase/ATPase domain-containing protein n=1 Tax=Halobacillus sp. K22 TaxID=3457431 RepID=UPI003FCE3475